MRWRWCLLYCCFLTATGRLVWSAQGQPPAPPNASDTRDSPDQPTEPDWTAYSTEPWPETLSQWDAMPAAPAEQQTLLDSGQVTFLFYDDQQFPRNYPGETRFSLRYQADTDYRWKLVRTRSGQWELVVRPQWKRIRLTLLHQILLPARYQTDNFFERALVRHELDHVRISSDPRYANYFRKRLRQELRQVHVPCAPNSPHATIAKQAVRERVEQIFQQTLDLIGIRYRELDQTTRHGTAPLPDDFFAAPESDARPSEP